MSQTRLLRRSNCRAPGQRWLDGAGVLVIAATLVVDVPVIDLRINAARDGRQTHMDLFDWPPCQGWEPATTTTNRTAVKIAKRRMG
ncbi:MAG TPA: hypothetical protein VHT28_16015 [Silvibacterium sp.]|nr:hypothetical protein [Silvibacterium sp.]